MIIQKATLVRPLLWLSTPLVGGGGHKGHHKANHDKENSFYSHYLARTRSTGWYLFSYLYCLVWMANKGISHQNHLIPFPLPDTFFLIPGIEFLKKPLETCESHLDKTIKGQGREGNGIILTSRYNLHRSTGRKPCPNAIGCYSTTFNQPTVSPYDVPIVPGPGEKERQNSLSLSRRNTLETGWGLFYLLYYH